MSTPYTRAPHQGSPGAVHAAAPNAALLIDFDNVTMGMRSDLSKDLQKLLQSEVIKGKVTVQRAYADWRRYPQYIVPLSENSIDLIFAPAYGTSKKNATDIRMAIDGMELVFTRPEIGTFILLTGDSDFSSLVLKLKEYGKYVIGVGIQESSSDILVQNCDEYYSYTTLTGLQKTSETDQKPVDPWLLVEQAIRKMRERDDVMRSDRLKQVMIEIDPSFDEGTFGYSKFSRFLTEAASKGLVKTRKMENGQYEVAPGGSGGGSPRGDRGARPQGGRADQGSKGRRPDRKGDRDRQTSGNGRSGEGSSTRVAEADVGGDPLRGAYSLLEQSLQRLLGEDREAVRDSDVKRKMLELDPAFDEALLGFSKFSRFLHVADEQGVIELTKRESGNYEVRWKGEHEGGREEGTSPLADERVEDAPTPEATSAPEATGAGAESQRLGPRRGSTRRRGWDGQPHLFEGQAVRATTDETGHEDGGGSAGSVGDLDLELLGLPTDREAVIRYLSNSYKGVGAKTAEALVDGFGNELFTVLNSHPERVGEVIPSSRADVVVDAWREDLERRRGAGSAKGSQSGTRREGARRTRRGGGRS